MRLNDLTAPIYLDYAASTPVDAAVVQVMHETLLSSHANPSAKSHRYGWQADQLVQSARADIAETLNCYSRELLFTSGATEADNIALQGVLRACLMGADGEGAAGDIIHVVTSQVEHKAVLSTLQAFEKYPNIEVSYLAPDPGGAISVDAVAAVIRPDTRLVSLMQVNNELGGVTDVAAIGRLLSDKDIVFHVDAAQSLGKIPVDLAEMGADLVSFSAHKAYGPKGVGALFVKRSVFPKIEPVLFGGGQEMGLRAGTLPTHQIAGFAKAVELVCERLQEDLAHITVLCERLKAGLTAVPGIQLHVADGAQVPHIVHLTAAGIQRPEALLMGLTDLAVGTGSACNSERVEPSHVLHALGVSKQEALTGIRLSLGRETTLDQIAIAVQQISHVVTSLRV